jgi:hypothetical protein
MHAVLPTDHPFLNKHTDKIANVLSCFDRLIFRGYLPICHTRGLYGWLHQLGVKYWNFKHFAPQLANRLLQHAKDMAENTGRPYQYLPTRQPKEELARRIAVRDGIREGLVCVFSCLENCRTFRLKYGQDKPRLFADVRRCTVLYYFFMDPEFGLVHVKLHAWLPLTCQVYVNGHSWLERQLQKHRIGYRMVDNAFVHLDNPAAAQRLADRLLRQKWPRLLTAWARQVNPLFADVLRGAWGRPFEYYWVTDQAEFATDVLFRKRQDLSGLYPALLEHATLALGSQDVLRFLGRKPSPCFQGEVQTERKLLPLAGQHHGRYRDHDKSSHAKPGRKDRDERRRLDGTRVKHVMKTNRLKMYDKAGRVLRIETVINDPTEFRVRRWQQNKHGGRHLAWLPLRKGVAWLWRYAQVALAANRRYLEALAAADDHAPARKRLDRISRPAPWGARRKRALQPLSPQDQALFRAVLRGEHHLHGLKNADLVRELYGNKPPQDAAEARRRSASVTRLLQLLRAHGLIAKVPRARRYRVTPAGLSLMSCAIYIRHNHLPRLLQAVA